MHSATTRMAFALGALLALSACEEGQTPGFLQNSANGATQTSTANRSVKTVERDTEAPDVFQASDKGLWDGRPSLGGVWVAHPDAKDPERVIIRNSTNQKFVVGVLYRPERQQPGPAFQVSSDAADALGMLAGAPADLNVTALRREEVAETPTPTAVAAATPGTAATTQGTPATDAAITDTAVASTEPATPPKKPFNLFGRPNKNNAATTTAATATAAAPSVAAAPLDPIAAASAALDQAEGKPATPPATVAAATPPRTTAPSSSGTLSKPFIQIGIFSVETNANNTAESLRRAGMVPTIKPGNSSGKDFWRVVVGPATSTNERAQLLKKIKDLGFNDAYFVTN